MTTDRKARRAAHRLLRLCRAGDRLDGPRVHLVVARVAASRRRNGRRLLREFLRLLRATGSRHTAIVETATALDRDGRNRFRARLAHSYGTALETSFVLTPALIGGVRITVGSVVWDGSVQGRLAAIEDQFAHGPAAR